jgi:hypothetical protein
MEGPVGEGKRKNRAVNGKRKGVGRGPLEEREIETT